MEGKRLCRGDWLKGYLDNPATSAIAERLYREKPEDLQALRALVDVLHNADLRMRGKRLPHDRRINGPRSSI